MKHPKNNSFTSDPFYYCGRFKKKHFMQINFCIHCIQYVLVDLYVLGNSVL